MNETNKVFNYCKYCETLLSGQQRKFCCRWCKDLYHSDQNRAIAGKKQLKQMIEDRKPLNYLRLNSSEEAYKQALKLIK
tara:strand:- start:236 stop:472 length:237 start_codon:yes stop_codon:yes gene_type:complete